eukprot:1156044-Pelagomonas_calceolata.AAC.2
MDDMPCTLFTGSLDAPQTRAMVGKVASFAASSGVRGSALPRVSEEQPPPPPCNTSRSSSAGEGGFAS